MGILSRFRDIMASNVNALLDKADNPEKTIEDYMRNLSSDLGKVKAETASVLAEERRAKRALDECKSEIQKLQRYAEKAVEAGNDGDALKFLERKTGLTAKLNTLQSDYELASSNAVNMTQMQDKLVADMGRLEAKRAELKGKMAAAKVQQQLNDFGSSEGDVHSAFKAMEDKANLAMDEAMALAELRAGAKEDDLDELIAELERSQDTDKTTDVSTPETALDELASLKNQLRNKE